MSLFNFFSKSNKSIEELIHDGDFEKALTKADHELKVALGRDDHSQIPVLRRQLVRCQLELDRTDEAVAALCQLGEYYTERGFFPKAVATYKKALKLCPDNAALMERIAEFNNQVPKYFINTQQAKVLLEKSALSKKDGNEVSEET